MTGVVSSSLFAPLRRPFVSEFVGCEVGGSTRDNCDVSSWLDGIFCYFRFDVVLGGRVLGANDVLER